MIWCHKNAKFDACGPPLAFDQNLMPVVPPYHVTKIWCLWSPLPCDQNLMPVVPPYHLTKIWWLWSPLTSRCQKTQAVDLWFGVTKTQGYSLMIWCHKNAKFDACGPPLAFDQIWCLWSPLSIWPKFDACGPPLPCDQNLMPVVPPYHVTKIWGLWSPLTMWPKFDACGPPSPFEQNLMTVVPPYQ